MTYTIYDQIMYAIYAILRPRTVLGLAYYPGPCIMIPGLVYNLLHIQSLDLPCIKRSLCLADNHSYSITYSP